MTGSYLLVCVNEIKSLKIMHNYTTTYTVVFKCGLVQRTKTALQFNLQKLL